MYIYDCFQYFDEDFLLDLRLNILDKYVKKFVISEATYTHNGSKKKLNFDINKFKKFQDKIIYIVVENTPPDVKKILDSDNEIEKNRKLILNGMARDYFQRENLTRGLKDAEENDIVMVSDLDEIPNLDNFNFASLKNKVIIFQQKLFYYKLNLYYENFTWHGTRACKKRNLLSPQWLRNIKAKKFPFWRLDLFFSKKKYTNLFFVKNGGWHFSYLKTPEQLQKKLLNFAHHLEFEKTGINLDEINKMVGEKRIIYDHSTDKKDYLKRWSGEKKLKIIDDIQLPKYVVDNKTKFKDWFENP